MLERVINNFNPFSSLSFTQVTLSNNLDADFLFIKNNMEKEIWKDVQGYEGHYEVSNYGNVRSIQRKVKGRYNNFRISEGRILKPSKKTLGYLGVTFCINQIRKCFSIHRLVAIAFLPNPEFKTQTNHKNGIKDDNKASNLEWVTQSENGLHAYKSGLQKIRVGDNARYHKLTGEQVKEIRSLHATGKYYQKDLAAMFNCGFSNINQIVLNKIWKHL